MEEILKKYKDKAKNVEFCCLEIDTATDVMFKKMKIAMQSLNIQKLDNVYNFAEVITSTINSFI